MAPTLAQHAVVRVKRVRAANHADGSLKLCRKKRWVHGVKSALISSAKTFPIMAGLPLWFFWLSG